jgi:dihydroxy-acid dehydratase
MTETSRTYDPRGHSRELLDGPDSAAARSKLKDIGFTDDELSKPIIGVGTTWIETMPCNYHQRVLAFRVTTSAVARRRRRSGRPKG